MAFIGINVRWDKDADALQFMQRFNVPYPLVRDASGAVGRSYGVEATPTTYVLDRNGRVAASTLGEVAPGALDRMIESALAKS